MVGTRSDEGREEEREEESREREEEEEEEERDDRERGRRLIDICCIVTERDSNMCEFSRVSFFPPSPPAAFCLRKSSALEGLRWRGRIRVSRVRDALK